MASTSPDIDWTWLTLPSQPPALSMVQEAPPSGMLMTTVSQLSPVYGTVSSSGLAGETVVLTEETTVSEQDTEMKAVTSVFSWLSR